VRPSLEDVRHWLVDGANVGLLANRFPGVDIDCTDEKLAQIIEDAALREAGACAYPRWSCAQAAADIPHL